MSPFPTHTMQMLHTAFKGNADIVACSHAGHDSGPANTGKLFSLSDQINHKAEFIKQQLLVPGEL